jgi:hypothetical protein
MTDPCLLLKNVEHLGRAYCDRYLDWDREKLESDWFQALKFFFNHSFMRGRRDELSNEYYSFTIDRLQHDILGTETDREAYHQLQRRVNELDKDVLLDFKRKYGIRRRTASKHARFAEEIAERHEVIRLLTTPKIVAIDWGNKTYEKKVKLGNDNDVLMVLDTLKFISVDERCNIYTCLRAVIRDEGVHTAYAALTQLWAVGDKIATFLIRDIGLMNLGLIQDDYEIAFPVDTWVRRLARQIGCNTASDKGIKQHFIQQCKEASIDPLLVAAGLWYVGYHSVEILLDEYLGRCRITGGPRATRAGSS